MPEYVVFVGDGARAEEEGALFMTEGVLRVADGCGR